MPRRFRCDLAGDSGELAPALCFEPRGLALCELRHARFPLSISLWRNAFNSRAGNFELLGPTAKIFQFVIRAAREVSGFAPLQNSFIHESRRSETVANNGDFGETKADFRCVLLGHEKSHVLPRARRRWIRFINASGFMSAVSATSSTAAVWMSPLGGRSPFARMRASTSLTSWRKVHVRAFSILTILFSLRTA